MYPLSAGVVVQTRELWDELNRSLQDLSIRLVFELSEIPPDWAAFLDRIERVRPDVIMLDVTRLREPLEDVVRKIRSTSVTPAVFALHTTADSTAILAALRAGAAEYLHPPLHEPLKAALERLSQARETSREGRRAVGKTVGFVSAKGGCGATTLACHVATLLPRLVRTKVLLADLDLQAGLVAFLAKAKSPYSVADAVNNLQRLDQSFWHGLISNGIPDLEILTAPQSPGAKQVLAPQLKQVLAFARSQYGWSVLDLGRNLTGTTLSMLDLVDETYVVTTHEVPALHQAKQMIRYLVESGYPQSNIRLILNRLPKRLDVTLDEIEQMLGLSIFATLVNDYQALQEAYVEGRLVSDDSHLGKSFARLARKIAGTTEDKKKKFTLFG